MNILQNNPYRLLGVYSNSPTKERLANHNRMRAFLKVGKSVSFSLDLPQYLSSINRTDTSVAEADAKLTLPKDQILYAQFWFIKTTPLDDVAFNHLIAGEISKAEEIWQKKECASSLQNRIVCALMQKKYDCSIRCAEVLYRNAHYVNQFVSAIAGNDVVYDVTNLAFSFIDILCDEIGANKLLPFITNNTWQSHIEEKTVKPLIDSIQGAIDIAKKSKGRGPNARLNAGENLRKNTRSALLQLKEFLSATDLQYQIIADKLGLEILQCSIDYFNDSEEPDAAYKAMSLQKQAISIVVGQIAKDRCKENFNILQKIIDNLPPIEVLPEDKAIKEELDKCVKLPEKIHCAVNLLNNTKPHLQSIKTKLGENNSFYLKLSTIVVINALHNIIEKVNTTQHNAMYNSDVSYSYLKSVLRDAWNATRIMDSFDMESDFKNGRYKDNRSILKELCEHYGISTSTYTPNQSTEKHNQSNSDDWIIPTWCGWFAVIFLIGILFFYVATNSNNEKNYTTKRYEQNTYLNESANYTGSYDKASSANDRTNDILYKNENSYSSSEEKKSNISSEYENNQTADDYEIYIDNHLSTGTKPYKKYYKSRTGENYIDFKTSENDYVIIVREHETSDVVNHIYIRANDKGRLYLPNGTFIIYFYGGRGWNPKMENGNVRGGFILGGNILKDGPIELYNSYGEYTLYPVKNGNLRLQNASKSEAF